MAGSSPAMTNSHGVRGADIGGGPRPTGFFGFSEPA
jgi:hypothetical protein